MSADCPYTAKDRKPTSPLKATEGREAGRMIPSELSARGTGYGRCRCRSSWPPRADTRPAAGGGSTADEVNWLLEVASQFSPPRPVWHTGAPIRSGAGKVA